ncbi:SGNH/GDSL hydrolase family protein [Nocardioides humilatus]|uniref:SGNH/GDSL hydrolase family protein n=1 Tax=Nocardioides humilatus TaxID=2607660 RepID=A0A5B1LHY0_9ACTN|nr:SGNH/GDSL hydrolase family protein [Nocardioides humilatus]KAA1419227.1 SGNH/GDSL hydrolase family protein [Nocardioides humilatus]
MRIRGAWLVAVGLVAVVAVAGLVVTARAGADPSRCAGFRAAAAERSELVTGSGREVLVIGDSYSVGLGVGADHSWPTQLPGRVRVEGFSGSGFSSGASECGAGTSYAERAPRALAHDVRLVVVEGGLNDFDQPRSAIRRGFTRLVGEFGHQRVLVVGPAPAPARADAVLRVDGLLARLSEQYGVGYLSMLDTDLPYLEDRLHLTEEGHRAFGDRVARALSTASRPGR